MTTGFFVVKVFLVQLEQIRFRMAGFLEEYIERHQHRGLAATVGSDKAGVIIEVNRLVGECPKVLNADG
jgi:hypothetical protein